LLSADILRTGGRDFFKCSLQKATDFSKFMVCPHGRVGEGQLIAILCGRP